MSPHPDSSLSESWSVRHILTATFIVAFVAIQVAIPTVRLLGHHGERFGWQMFATSGPDVIVIGQPRSGGLDTLDVSPYFAFRRSDLDLRYLARLPEHICRVTRSFNWIAVRQRDGSTVASVTCR